jgi:H+-transporting ATPase
MQTGLATTEAHKRLEAYGPNTVPEEHPRLILIFLKKFWGPVPWMLELSLILELVIGHYTQAAVISVLLIFNSVIAFIQENRAQSALALLQQRLAIQVKVMRDGAWQLLPSQEIVPGDVVHLRVGDIVPADTKLLDGYLSVDQSTLTGESLARECAPEDLVYAGSVIQHGDANGEVAATGLHTYYGRTAELVHTAQTASHLETMILGIVRYLVALDFLLVLAVLVYSWVNAIPLTESLPFAIMLLVASVPVALPTTFTLANALGAQELAKNGALVTRLSAIEEAAALDVLCSDKTGTITQNRMVLSRILCFGSHSENEVLDYAAAGSEEASQDPIDLAVLREARQRGLLDDQKIKLQFQPFDPLTKRTEAVVQFGPNPVHIIKGFPPAVATLAPDQPGLSEQVDLLAGQGYRVLAVAAGQPGALEMLGLLGFDDPPREDTKDLIQKLQGLAIRVVLITGDGLATARAVARQVGLGNLVCTAEAIRQGSKNEQTACDVVAGVLPEDKFHLVQSFQEAGHVVGMTGDGVNDAPALKQAEVGIAVSNATDVARAAASVVLTEPGLSNILSAIKTGRQIYQRMLTYTLNKLVKTFQIALFLSLGLFFTGLFVTTPRLIILLLFANDFVTMSLASDRVGYSQKPDHWQIRPLVMSALIIALAWLVFSFGVLYLGIHYYRLEIAQLQTFIFVMLVFTGLANVYLVRNRGHFWQSAPGTALWVSTLADCLIVILLATQGILMTPIDIRIIGILILLVVIYVFILDLLKVIVFRSTINNEQNGLPVQ